jgi:hypothetical protein
MMKRKKEKGEKRSWFEGARMGAVCPSVKLK